MLHCQCRRCLLCPLQIAVVDEPPQHLPPDGLITSHLHIKKYEAQQQYVTHSSKTNHMSSALHKALALRRHLCTCHHTGLAPCTEWGKRTDGLSQQSFTQIDADVEVCKHLLLLRLFTSSLCKEAIIFWVEGMDKVRGSQKEPKDTYKTPHKKVCQLPHTLSVHARRQTNKITAV